MGGWNKGLITPDFVKDKIRQTKIAEKNPNWKGDKVGKSALHEWIGHRKPRPQFCECCKTGFPIDLANISQKYKRDLSDWEYLCRKCHMTKDGRMGTIRKQHIRMFKRTHCKICNKEMSSYKYKVCKIHLNLKGSKNPNWKGGFVYGICRQCCGKFKCTRYQKKHRKFCSKRCYWNSKKGIIAIPNIRSSS